MVQQGEKARDQAEQVSKKTQASRTSKSSGAFRTISEVADELGVQQHVLRFWETKFSHVRPLKRGGGRRYYRPEDVDLLKRIHHLLYIEGYTIKGVQKLLKDVGKNQVLKGAGTSQALIQNPVPDTTAQENEKKPASVAEARSHQGRLPLSEPQNSRLTDRQRTVLETMLEELRELRNLIKPKK
ncbi:MAG: MerR family transcriptional regulator [Rhodospirillales bacterium]|nr:MerR family transcriptional regulator [Alphaproteobacteria bacterium]MCB1840445.1 MerR family transcriptional regulator [Alphaproteobacteria bacterium]MCB9976005.1 MerR family transcriptional regulator [Rhodospirillales bacterium]